jgi:hypothetical protein
MKVRQLLMPVIAIVIMGNIAGTGFGGAARVRPIHCHGCDRRHSLI